MSNNSSRPKRRKAGQPTKYKKEYCDMLVEHMKQGYSYETFAAVIDVHPSTLYNWEEGNDEWCEAKVRAFNACRIFWEKCGLEGMFMGGKDNPFNSTVWVFNMKNRFNWTDKRETKVDAQVKLEDLVDDSME